MNIAKILDHPAAQQCLDNKSQPQPYFQCVLDVCYSHWQIEANRCWTYRDMVDNAEKTYGPMAKLFVLIGKFNQQVTNGGVFQYYDNGFADGTKERTKEVPLHIEMVDLFKKSNLLSFEHGPEFLSVIEDFHVSNAEAQCSACGGSGNITLDCDHCNGTGVDAGECCPICDGKSSTEEDCIDCSSNGFQVIENQYAPENQEELNARYFKFAEKFMEEVNGYLKIWYETKSEPQGIKNKAPQEEKPVKPRVRLTGIDGNAYSIISKVSRALKESGYSSEQIAAFVKEAESGDYSNVIATAAKWCDVY